MKSVDIQRIQIIELEALSSFLQFCTSNGIKVFLRGGSVLGAVKYKGFIPWDDDIDVAIPRADYSKLINLMEKTRLSDKFDFYYWKFNSNVHSYFPRLALKEEERIRLNLPKNTEQGLHIMDIIPLDGSPNNGILRRLFYLYIYILRALASTNTVYQGEHKNPHTKKQQSIINFLRLLGIHKIFEQKSIYQKMDMLFSKYQWNKSDYSGTVTASLGNKESLESSIWGEGIATQFSGVDVLIPVKYDIYLKKLYGSDYMAYTPKDSERKSHFV